MISFEKYLVDISHQLFISEFFLENFQLFVFFPRVILNFTEIIEK